MYVHNNFITWWWGFRRKMFCRLHLKLLIVEVKTSKKFLLDICLQPKNERKQKLSLYPNKEKACHWNMSLTGTKTYKQRWWPFSCLGSRTLWKERRAECFIVTEHSSEKMMSSRSSLSDKVFKQCSILFDLLTSLINRQYFVPLQDQPNFSLTCLTVQGGT